MSEEPIIMPFGKHKGLKLEDVPAKYLLWLYDQDWMTKFEDIMDYIAGNYESLEAEVGDDY